MKIKPILNYIDIDNFIPDYLQAYGIDNFTKFLRPDESCLDSCDAYIGMREAVDTFMKFAKPEYDNSGFPIPKKAGVLIDSDCDGIMSGTLMINYLNLMGFSVKPYIHTGKQHGLSKNKSEDIIKQVLESEVKLLFIPDAGSNDVKECEELKNNGIEIIILDHHPIIESNPYAIVVNPYIGINTNTHISGAGVTWKFIHTAYERYTKEHIEINKNFDNFSKWYGIDHVAISLVSDVCDLSALENRYFVHNGIAFQTNELIQHMYKKLCKDDFSPHGIGWYIAPVINALCRCGTMEEKMTFVKAMCGYEKPEEGLKVARRAHRRQTEESKRIMEEIEPEVDLNHKAIIGFGDASDANFLGLCANKFLGKYNKPTFLLRELDDTHWTGSLRSPIPIAEQINNSGIAKAQGHEEAAGITLTKKKLTKFIEWLDNLDWSIEPEIEVAGELNPKEISIDFCNNLTDVKEFFGHGLEEPKFYITGKIKPNTCQVFRKSTNTIKFVIDDIEFLKFRATEEEICKFENGGIIEMVVSLSVNEWNDIKTCQGIIENYELEEFEQEDYNEDDWMEDF